MSYFPYDEEGRLQFNNKNRGNAWFFLDGKKITGYWEKKNTASKTAFFDENGKEMVFNRGQTWIAILDDPQKIRIEQ